MKRRLLGFIAVLLFAIPLFADDDPQTPYPIEERCVEAPTLALDDFTYSGRLLMTGYAGIHAMRADWETPRVEAFFNENELGVPIDGGQLSPDGRWYAVPIGEIEIEVSLNQFWVTNGLRVYSTIDDEEISFNLTNYDNLLNYDRSGYYGTAWVYQATKWINNNELIIGSFHIQPFSNVVEESLISIAEAYFADFEVSPDWTRVYTFAQNPQRGKAIVDPNTRDDAITYVDAIAVAWLRDSSGFVAHQVDSEENLALFDRNGEFVEQVYSSPNVSLDIRRKDAGRNELGWSPDDRYFALGYSASPIPPKLMLLDTKDKITINTCLKVVSDAVWSPDGTQLAFLMRGKTNLNIVILDLEKWKATIVGQHSGSGWGVLQPDMLAWIDDE